MSMPEAGAEALGSEDDGALAAGAEDPLLSTAGAAYAERGFPEKASNVLTINKESVLGFDRKFSGVYGNERPRK